MESRRGARSGTKDEKTYFASEGQCPPTTKSAEGCFKYDMARDRRVHFTVSFSGQPGQVAGVGAPSSTHSWQVKKSETV